MEDRERDTEKEVRQGGEEEGVCVCDGVKDYTV